MNAARLAMRGLGELFITLGAVLLLFVIYQLFWTNVAAHAAASKVTDEIEQQWDSGLPDVVPPAQPSSEAPAPSAAPPTRPPLDEGQGFARIYIPRLGKDYVKPVLEGVGLPDLARGIGHYPKTQLPGEIGNVALAGHRATNGEPFRNLDQMRPGDAVVIETKSSWFTYTVTRSEIVAPSATDVLLPVPRRAGEPATREVLTLTTCNPRWASYERLIVYGELTDQRLKSAGDSPALAGTG